MCEKNCSDSGGQTAKDSNRSGSSGGTAYGSGSGGRSVYERDRSGSGDRTKELQRQWWPAAAAERVG